MLFYASKILFFLVQPSSLCLALLVGGLGLLWWRRKSQAGPALILAGVAALVIGGLSPLANVVIYPLEQRFPKPDLATVGPQVAGLIILGGFEDSSGEDRDELGLNEAAERVTESVVLAARLPKARVVFTGGVGTLIYDEKPAAARIGQWLQSAGISADRIRLEDKSRNTWENAIFTRDMLGAEFAGRWLLVTSAHHMPRSMGVFRQAGFDVIAWPVDYRTQGAGDLLKTFSSIPDGLRRLDGATKEWIGLAAYFLMGRTSALFPAP